MMEATLLSQLTIPDAVLAECVRGFGRKRHCSPAASSVHTNSSAARGLFDRYVRTRRDASPPSSGGLFFSSGILWLLPSCVFSCAARWRGSG